MEGRLLETILKAERGAAPAGGARNPALGRPRDPIGGHYDLSARSSLDWEWTNGCRTAEVSLARKGVTPRPAGPVHKPGNADPRTEKPPWRAERRRTFARRCAHKEWSRRLARHPPRFVEGTKEMPRERGEDDGLPGAAKNTGDIARLLFEN